MTAVTGPMVKDLRDKTGAGMMDCKAALVETNGDVEAAIDLLRKKGITKAAKKASRVAAEGLIGVAVGGDAGALVEVNAETDFVARNDEFKSFVKRAAELALEAGGDVDKLLAQPHGASGVSVKDTVNELVAKIGENIAVRRTIALSVSPGIVATYVHNAASPELGKIGVLVALKSTADKGKLAELGRGLAMHIAAASPLALTPDHLSPDAVARERAIAADIARQSGKPENVVEKMIEGRMRKFFEESVLLSQTSYIDRESAIAKEIGLDSDVTIAKVLEKASAKFGTPVVIEGFVRFAVGEGIEKIDGDFGDEVNKLAGR